MKPVQTGRGRRRWSAEQKLTVLQEWQTGFYWPDDRLIIAASSDYGGYLCKSGEEATLGGIS